MLFGSLINSVFILALQEWICAEEDDSYESKNPFQDEEMDEEENETSPYDENSTVPLTGNPGEDVSELNTFYRPLSKRCERF